MLTCQIVTLVPILHSNILTLFDILVQGDLPDWGWTSKLQLDTADGDVIHYLPMHPSGAEEAAGGLCCATQ